MISIQLSKTDVKQIVIGSALLPIICFVSGFFISSAFSPAAKHQDTPSSTPLTSTTNNTTIRNTSADKTKEYSRTGTSTESMTQDSNSQLTENNKAALEENRYIVQAGIFSKLENAEKLQLKLHQTGLETKIVGNLNNNQRMHSVSLHAFPSKKDASNFLNQIKEQHDVDLYISELHLESFEKPIASI